MKTPPSPSKNITVWDKQYLLGNIINSLQSLIFFPIMSELNNDIKKRGEKETQFQKAEHSIYTGVACESSYAYVTDSQFQHVLSWSLQAGQKTEKQDQAMWCDW